MKLTVYKNQKEIEKVYEIEAYDIMYGTMEDFLSILDGLDEKSGDDALFAAIMANRDKINKLILDVFPDMTKEEIRRTKVRELVPFFVEMFVSVSKAFGETGKN